MKTKKFTGDRIFDFVNVTVILLITIIILVHMFSSVQWWLLHLAKRI